MGQSLSHGKKLDVGAIGLDLDDDLLGVPPGVRSDTRIEPSEIRLAELFPVDARDRRLELEIGSGKGTFLVQQACLFPEVNYVGVEYAKAFWRYGADRCRRNGLENVRLIRAEAERLLRGCVAGPTFACVHIYFPDPWPKRRHHVRRLIQERFLRLLHGYLLPGASVRLVTDHSGYFQWMVDRADEVRDLFVQVPYEGPASAGEGEWVGTNFERKYRRQGRQFDALVLKKVGPREA